MIRNRDTGPELKLRKALRQEGLGYRINWQPIPGLRRTADIVFLRPKVAVFVDGCYWHGCPQHYRPSVQRAQFWSEKISRNVIRDAETTLALEQQGWHVVRIWEHADADVAAAEIARVVRERRLPLRRG